MRALKILVVASLVVLGVCGQKAHARRGQPRGAGRGL
jgi:hypothetical protein